MQKNFFDQVANFYQTSWFTRVNKIHLLWLLPVLMLFSAYAGSVTNPFVNNNTQVTRPTIRIATLPYNPPFELSNTNTGEIVGFEVDIMTSICDVMAINCVFRIMSGYDDMFTALDKGEVDLTMASIVIVKGSESYLFSYPFLPSYVQFFVQKDSAIQSNKDIFGKHIGMINDPLLQATMLRRFGTNTSINVFTTMQAGIQSLANGNIDAMVMEAMSVDYWLTNTGGTFKTVGDPIPFGFGYGVMTIKNRFDLISQIDNAMTILENNGTYARIYNRYFGLQFSS